MISISGDGGFGWGQQELATLSRYGLNLTAVIFVDGRFGNVQRIQKRTFGVEYATEVFSPNFPMLARSYGIAGAMVDSPARLEQELIAAGLRGGPALIAVRVAEMPSPWALIHPFVPPASAPPPDPLADLDTGALTPDQQLAQELSPTAR